MHVTADPNIGVGASPAGPVLAGHFLGDVMKFIIEICAHTVTNHVPYAHIYYSWTTLKVLPTPPPNQDKQ